MVVAVSYSRGHETVSSSSSDSEYWRAGPAPPLVTQAHPYVLHFCCCKVYKRSTKLTRETIKTAVAREKHAETPTSHKKSLPFAAISGENHATNCAQRGKGLFPNSSQNSSLLYTLSLVRSNASPGHLRREEPIATGRSAEAKPRFFVTPSPQARDSIKPSGAKSERQGAP